MKKVRVARSQIPKRKERKQTEIILVKSQSIDKQEEIILPKVDKMETDEIKQGLVQLEYLYLLKKKDPKLFKQMVHKKTHVKDFNLYYDNMRYRQEMVKMRKQLIIQVDENNLKKDCTFSPRLNQKSMKMMSNSNSQVYLKSTQSSINKSIRSAVNADYQERKMEENVQKDHRKYRATKFYNQYQGIVDWNQKKKQDILKKQIEKELKKRRDSKEETKFPVRQRPNESEDMKLNQLIFAKDSLWETFNFLAKTEEVMFVEEVRDHRHHQSSMQTFSQSKIKQLEDIRQIVLSIKTSMNEFGWQITKLQEEKNFYYDQIDEYMYTEGLRGDLMYETFEKQINQQYNFLEDLKGNYDQLLQQRLRIFDQLQGLQHINSVLSPESIKNLGDLSRTSERKIQMIVGLVETKDILKIRQMLFRIVRQNVAIKTLDMNIQRDPLIQSYLNSKNKIYQPKTLIVLVFPMTSSQYLFHKIEALIGMREFISLEDTLQDKNESVKKLMEELELNTKIIETTRQQIDEILCLYSESKIIQTQSFINVVQLIFDREKNFALQMQNLEDRNGFYQAKLWIPASKIDKFITEMDNIRYEDIEFTKPQLIPYLTNKILLTQNKYKVPSKFHLSNFFYPFQLMINTYGIPTYKEINPSLFSTVTFPFQFGLMFGDVGHGLILLLLTFMVFYILAPVIPDLDKFKYLLLLMSIFSIFCGLIYNDFFGMPLLLFDSCYNNYTFERKSGDCVYPIGLDWIWSESQTETNFVNSFKMKFSIIVGVLHMLLGIFLKFLNGIYFKKPLDIIFEAIPQFTFMFCSFGYMCLCIIIKWSINWDKRESVSIISLFINFINVEDSLYFTASKQQSIQIILVIICLACILLMLIPKPFILYAKQGRMELANDSAEDIEFQKMIEEDSNSEETPIIHHENHSLGELIVHQLIETIEFVLGSVSNTASYLRLWALSLAHTQLARVFYQMIFGWTIEESNNIFTSFLVIILGLAFWFFVTLGVIIIMDLMECFLHALRLHWVEFQNKFYKGDGIDFIPFRRNIQNQFI